MGRGMGSKGRWGQCGGGAGAVREGGISVGEGQ